MNVLTNREQGRLNECEKIIQRGFNTFVEVGQALLEIRDSRLYKMDYSTFEDYCRERWGVTKVHAYRLMDASEVIGNLQSNQLVTFPVTESQARPLSVLPPEIQAKAWQKAIDTAPNGKVTAAHVQDVVENIIRGYRKERIHVSDDSYEWYTPSEYVDAARLVMGGIDLDPASCKEANKVLQIDEFYTEADDGLTSEWFGRVWLNPPYNMPDIEQFTARAHELYQNKTIAEAVVLVNNATDSAWFHTLIENYPVCFTRGRVRFWGPHTSQGGARQGQAIFYLGKKRSKFYKEFSKFGAIVFKYDDTR